MIHKKSERGQALILIAFAAIGLFAFAALAIDGSRSFSNKRHAQNTADTAVLTAALTAIRTTGSEVAKFNAAEAAAILRAESNGYVDDGGTTTIVDVDRCDDVRDYDADGNLIPIPGDLDAAGNQIPCEGIDTAHAAEFLRVKIISSIPTTFGRVIGRDTLTSAAEAIARVEGTSSSAVGTSMSGAAMYATSQEPDHGKACFNVSGGADIHVYGSGIYVNCDKNEAVVIQSGSGSQNTTFVTEKPSPIPGCYTLNGGATNPGIQCDKGSSLPIDETTFAYVNTKPATPNCSDPSLPLNPYDAGTKTYNPGKYTSIIKVTENRTIKSGLYCLTDTITGIANLTQANDGGVVKFVMLTNNKYFTTGTGTFTFDDLEVYTEDANLIVEGTLNAERFRYYSSGAGEFQVKNGDTIWSDDAYIYLHRGKYNPIAGANLDLHAPAQGDPYVGGVLIHQPWANTNPVTINGGSNMKLVGTFLAPHATIEINGGADFVLYSQLIGYEFKINGGGQVAIHYLASQNLPPPAVSPANIKFTK